MNWPYRAVLGFSSILCLILIAFLNGQVTTLRTEVAALHADLATKEDLLRVSVPPVKFFHEERCTSCHAERRFAGEHNVPGEMESALSHMKAMPDAHFTDQDMAKIHASLSLLRCKSCHSEEKLRLLALKSPEERMAVIQRMALQPGSNLNPDEVESIHTSYQQLFGF